MEKPINEITEIIIGAAYKVSNTLGTGFLEKVYENALKYELSKAKLNVDAQKKIYVSYEGILVGEYIADLLVESKVIIELKAVEALDEFYSAQCINYLKATKLNICLLLNFGVPKVEVKRFAY